MQRILITGGAGFIGSHLAEHFEGRAEVRVLDNLRTGYRRNLDGLSCTLIEGSVTDRAVVREAMDGIDRVFHLAAMVSVPESMERPADCVAINTLGTLTVLEEAARAGVRKLCFASTSAIYGDNPVMPKTEAMLPEPCSPYAVTKLDGEYYCGIFRREQRLDTVCLRFFNVFGPRQDPGSAYAAAIPIFMQRALRGEPLTIYGDGEQTRDFIYVKDIVGAAVMLAGCADTGGVYNAACGGALRINALAETIIALAGSSSAIVHAPPRAGDVRHSTAATDKLAAAGYTPQHKFRDALAATLEAIRAG